jgi:signal transduction histidine kinase/CheY-like chemotaxis protein
MIDKLLRFHEKEMQTQYDNNEIRVAQLFQRHAFYMFLSFTFIEYILRYLLHEQMFGSNLWDDDRGTRNFMNQTIATFIGLLAFIALYLADKKFRKRYSFFFDLAYAVLFTGFVIVDLRILWSDKDLMENMNLSFLAFEFMWKVYVMFAFIFSRHFRILCMVAIFLYMTGTIVQVFGWQVYFVVEALLNGVYTIAMLYLRNRCTKIAFVGSYHEVKAGDTMKWILNAMPESILIIDKMMNPRFTNTFFSKMFGLNPGAVDVHGVLSKLTDITVRNLAIGSGIFYNDTLNMSAPIENNLSADKDSTECLLAQPPSSKTDLNSNSRKLNPMSLFTMLHLDGKIEALFQRLNAIRLDSDESLVVDCKYSSEDVKKSIELKISLAKFYGEDCMIFICRDTTERDVIANLEDNNQFKDRLLASVSHELRTPLNGHLNLIELAADSSKVPEEIKTEYLIPALRCGKLLMHTISDLLDYSHINNQALKMHYTVEDIKKTTARCIQLIELQARQKSLVLNVTFGSDVPEKFCTDHNRFSQVLLNLLHNAVKFTYSGSIDVIIDRVCQIAGPQCLEIQVKDTGIGIKEKQLKLLFDTDAHIPLAKSTGKADEPQSGGIGLGLHISHHLAKFLSNMRTGGITVETIYGKGSNFKFILEDKSDHSLLTVGTFPELVFADGGVMAKEQLKSVCDISEHDDELAIRCPLIQFSPPAHTLTSISCKSKNRRRTNYMTLTNSHGGRPSSSSQEEETKLAECRCNKILVVDDDCFNILAVQAILKQLKISCDTAYNGEDAINRVIHRSQSTCSGACSSYKVILMDCAMPIMDGFEATKHLKGLMSADEIPHIPIVGCTAFTAAEKVDYGLSVGMVEFIFKPLSKAKVEGVLEKYFNQEK